MNHAHSFGRSQSDPILDHTIKIGNFFSCYRAVFMLITTLICYQAQAEQPINQDPDNYVGFKKEYDPKLFMEQYQKQQSCLRTPHKPATKNYINNEHNTTPTQQPNTNSQPRTITDLERLTLGFKRKLPKYAAAKKRIQKIKLEHPGLRRIIKQLKNPNTYCRVKHPSRLLLIGPSGCGKTTAAEALAKYCGMTCIFIKASSVANTFQNSGAQFFEFLFRTLKQNYHQQFMVIIDEISIIAQFSQDDRDLQQNKTATAFWLGLDEIRNERHICIVGTDNKDPENLPDQIKTRFNNNIFYFEPPKTDTIVSLIKDSLEYILEDDIPEYALHTCSDRFLHSLAQNISHLSLREIEDLAEQAKVLAIEESNHPYAIVTEHHLLKIFSEHNQSWYKKAIKNRSLIFKQLISPRACTLYAAVTGLVMHFYTKEYKEHGLFITALATLINNYLPVAAGQSNDVHLFNSITQMFGNYKYRVPANAPFAPDTKND